MRKSTCIYALQTLLLAAPATLGAQCLTDDFSSATPWTENTSGGASPSVFSNVMNFGTSGNGIQCSLMNYSYRSLGFTLNSADTWTAEIEFTPLNASNTSNNSTFTPAHTLLAVSAGSTNSWNSSTSGYPISNIDDVEVYYNCALNSASSTWSVYGRSKDGTTWNTASSGIVIDPVANPNTTYYIRLQRLSATQGMVSVFSDPAFTTHISGSPACFPIASTVTGLTHVQMGAIPQGGYVRRLYALMDNLSVCNNSFCDAYSSNAGWNQTGTGVSVPAAGPTCNFTACTDNVDRSEEKNLAGLIQHSIQWRAECEFKPTAVSAMGPGHGILCLAAGTTGNIWDFSPVNTQDVIAAYYSCTPYAGSAGWMLYGVAKDDGNPWSTPSTGINLPTLNITYYIVLERLDATCGKISVFSDAAHLIPLSGSPQTFTIPSGVTGLNTLSHTSMMQGSSSRSLTGTVDNTCIVNYFETGGTIGSNHSICSGSAANLLTNIASPSHVGCSGSGTYQWEMETFCGSGIWNAISGATSATYSPGVLTTTSCFRRAATISLSGSGCSSTTLYSNTVTVTVNGLPVVDAGTSVVLCCGPTYMVGGSPTASGGSSPYTYSWSPTNHLSCNNCANPTTDICQWLNSENYSYTVTVTDANGCVATDKVSIMRSPNCRLANPNDPDAELISIYPNPSDGMITVNIPESKLGETMYIYDLTGRVVYTEILSGQQSKINLSTFESGVYLIHIGSGENEFIQKIEIQH